MGNLYRRVNSWISKRIGRIFIMSLLVILLGGIATYKTMKESMSLGQQFMSIAQVITVRFYYKEDVDGWNSYLQDYNKSNEEVFRDAEFREVLGLLGDIKNFDGKDARGNQIQKELMTKIELYSKWAIAFSVIDKVAFFIAFMSGTALIGRVYLTKKLRNDLLVKKQVENWEEDFLDERVLCGRD